MQKNTFGRIFNIQRFSIHDGPGIRTIVFLKGCPLSCKWCHNPESHNRNAEISYNAGLCIGCGSCVTVCKSKCHSIKNGIHTFNRTNCILCGKCVTQCPGALEISGNDMTAKKVMEVVLKDVKYYEESGGGLTISGGEPMASPLFTYELLKLAKEHNIHTCIETSGYCDFAEFEKIAEYTDLFLYDYKISNPQRHKEMTGVSNKLIIENLIKLDSLGKKIVLRCPIIPGVNDNSEHLSGISDLANSLGNIQEINVLPYHLFGLEKYDLFGFKDKTKKYKVPQSADVENIRNTLKCLCKDIKII